ncbi:hypothetical protein BDBG_02903 [Blastomyces gilchristii SLH14081]|uniref:Uncharacterized protein n=1 Tax=Blastomyces gilchristii (strain SLH14081) TaxID=559298 RepID=A0A179UFC5_BLAGS|nr:uncharacterized protein BDBG_02903 [Blastomyces gilchristii SLH14081]OAT06736.1 hypothetical protein BDBG_02903 [Blastomyces gilchristii SLH14081]
MEAQKPKSTRRHSVDSTLPVNRGMLKALSTSNIRLLRLAPPVKLNQGYLQGYLSRNEPTNIIVQKPTSLKQACGKLPSYTRTISSKHGVTAKLSTPARQRHF